MINQNSTSQFSNSPSIEEINLSIEGMTCASCVLRIEKALKKIDGVESASVNLATETASIKFDFQKVRIDKLKETVEAIGYKVVEPQSQIVEEENYSEFDSKKTLKEQAYQKLTKDLIVSAILTIPIFLISMLMMWKEVRDYSPLSIEDANKILLILTTVVMIKGGGRFFKIAWQNARHLSSDMNTLVAIGTGSAYAYSSLVTLFPNLFHTNSRHLNVYFDTSAVIITLILFGRWLESRAKTKTTSAIKELIGLISKTARVIRDGKEVEIPIKQLVLNDRVIVRPGEKIPADGIIVEGYSSVDE
ncbi:MAG: cation transporter, partial [Ignavibacteria bacterium]|nr:cation transporter [Ignavibacteria bacterium]